MQGHRCGADRELGCVRWGNPDLDFENLNPDFPIEREIRKRISPPRNPSSGWISIKKSKSGFFGFPFYRSIGKSEKGFAKLFSWTAVFVLLIMPAWKDTQEQRKGHQTLKRLLRFLDSQTNCSWVWLILGNLSDKSETVSQPFFLLLCKLFVWIEHELNIFWLYTCCSSVYKK